MATLNFHSAALDWILWVAIGAGVGLIECVLLGRKAWPKMLLDVALGVVGAVVAGWFLLPISGTADPDSIHIAGLVGALFGAFMTVALAVAVRR